MENSDHIKSVFNKSQSRNPTKCKPEMGFKISKKKGGGEERETKIEGRKEKVEEKLLLKLHLVLFIYVFSFPSTICLHFLY